VKRYYVTPNNKQSIQRVKTFCKVFMKLDGYFVSYTPEFRKAVDELIEFMSDRRARNNGHQESVAIIDLRKEVMRVYD